jgi:integral membrane sensor domain MASE1
MSAATLALICVSEALAVAWLVDRNVHGPFALNRISSTATLILFAVTAPLAGGVLAAGVLTAAGASSPLIAWRSWALADALGILAAAPLALAAIAGRTRLRGLATRRKTVEFALVFTATIVVTASIFGGTLDPVIRVPAYVLPFLLWPAFRFGPGGTSATILVVSLIVLGNAAHGQGPLALTEVPAGNIVLRSQGAIVVAAVSLLLLASMVAERTRIAHENAVLVAELQQALAEVKTLRGFIPICAWCHKVRDDAGFWQQIEMYLDARTEATFSHSICPACAEEAHGEVASHDLPPRVT